MQWKRFSSIAILEMHSNEETNRVRSMSGFTPLNIYYEDQILMGKMNIN